MSELPPPPLPPLRVEPLGYHVPSTGPRRPGILVAVGVISIVVGALTVLTSCGGIFQAMMIGNMRAAMVAAQTSQRAAAYNVPPRIGLPAQETVFVALQRARPLSPKRQEMLGRLLNQAGDQMFPFAEEQFTIANVASSISESGGLTDAEGTKDYFILVNGRLEFSDTSAVFSPTGGGPSTRVDADQSTMTFTNTPATNPFPTTMALAGPAGMSREAITYAISLSINMLLSLYLIIIGILVLTQYRGGRRQHLIYAWLKIPVAIIASIAYGMTMSQMMTGMGPAMVGLSIGMAALTAFYIAVGCAYPIALLIVMNTQTVKEYYKNRTMV